MTLEIVKCATQNKSNPLCKNCKRSGLSEDNEYEEFNLTKTLMNGWKCDGYIGLTKGQ